MRLLGAVGLASFLQLVGCGTGTFECQSDAQCDAGLCEGSGYCSFPDDACDSGRRYGSLAGGGLAGTCVDVASETGTGGSATATGSGTTSGNPSGATPSTLSSSSSPPPTSGETTGMPDTDTAGETASDETASSTECGPTEACWNNPPEGWDGPVVALPEGSTACPDDFPTDAGTVNANLNAPEPQCDCACDAAVLCNDVAVYSAASGSCDGIDFLGDIVPDGSCETFNPETPGLQIDWNVVGDPCIATPDHVISSPTWNVSTALCRVETAASCADGYCLPTPATGALCIFRDGLYECPAGPYTEQVTRYRSLSDSRNCTDCSCNPPVGTQPVCQVSIFNDSGCDNFVGGVDSSQGDICLNPPEDETIALELEQVGSCGTPGGGDPTGEATAADPVTLCCAAG